MIESKVHLDRRWPGVHQGAQQSRRLMLAGHEQFGLTDHNAGEKDNIEGEDGEEAKVYHIGLLWYDKIAGVSPQTPCFLNHKPSEVRFLPLFDNSWLSRQWLVICRRFITVHRKNHMRPLFTLITILSLTWTNIAFAQAPASTPPPDWYMQDPENDHYQGISVERAYQTLLKDRPSRTIIVAVIDSGVDIDHEDLKNSIWTNEDEIPGNGIDDDKNGYIDDVHGWNFIGGKEGNVNEDTYELTREYVRLKSKFKDTPEGKVEKKQKKDYELYKTIRDKYEKRKAKEVAQFEAVKKQYTMYQAMEVNLKESLDTLKTVLKKDKITSEDLAGLQTNDPDLLFAKGLVTRLMKTTGQSDPDSLMNELDATVQYFKKGYDYYAVIVEYGYNENFDSRKIVGDDPANLKERHYGNNDVAGPDSDHGTHVAGIIAADRKNEIGIKGIADNVKIMSVRTVPNGDERDKDVANAIRYAVDNGAHIINMSFGKSWSPQKEVVDEAVTYAEKKGVLLVHAAGNDNQDID
ncbi:MAG: S8 family serine peptidase, partial [Bacteroidetes bacterium]|nr:S8 family serine peptidase [Bacteroidota bacterium]